MIYFNQLAKNRRRTRNRPFKISSGFLFSCLCLTTACLINNPISHIAIAQTTPTAIKEGYVLLNRGWVNDAIAAFQQALRSSPNAIEARLGLAIAYQRAGQDSNAWQTYQQVLQQDPRNQTALKAIGQLGSYRPEWQAKGITALTVLLQLTPNDMNSRAQRALLYGYQGQFAEAIADYQLILSTNPKLDTLLNAAQVYAYSGNYIESVDLFKRYQNTGKVIPDRAITAYALALRQIGENEQAIQLLKTRLAQQQQLDATTIELRAALAVAYQMNDQPELAATVLAPLRHRSEATLPLARSLSAMARYTGDEATYREAIELYQQVLQQTTNPSSGLVVEVADVMSEVPVYRGEALSLYQQAVQQQPNNLTLKIKQLILLNQLGRLSRSELIQKLQAVLQPLPEQPSERQLIAQALQQLDPPDPGLLSTYQELVKSGVNVPFLNYRIAQILIQNNQLDAARLALTTYQETPAGTKDLATELLLAEIERQENKLHEAAQRYEQLIARKPPAAVMINALRGLAGIRQAQGRIDDALQIYEQIVSQFPQATWAQLGKTSLAYQAKRISLSDAENILNQWLTAQPEATPPELFSLVGVLPPDPKREALYNRLLETQPNNLAILRRLVQVIAMRDPQEARSRLNSIWQEHSQDAAFYWLKGELAQTLGNLNEAAEAYQTILQQQPDNVNALLALGGVRFQQRHYSEAESIYKRAATLKPDDWDIQRILAELSLAQDHPQVAIQQLKLVEQIQKSQGITDAIVVDRLERVQVDYLRRRGFQPPWERY